MYDFPLWVHLLLASSAGVYVYYTVTTKTPLMFPTQQAAIDVILELVIAQNAENTDKSIKIYDLGSGAGGLVLKLAKAFPQATVVGVEIAWPAWLYAYVRQKLSRLKNAHFILKNFMDINVADGDVIIFYASDACMQQISEKLAKEGKQDCLIISNTFPLPAPWVPFKKICVQAALSKEIIAYRA